MTRLLVASLLLLAWPQEKEFPRKSVLTKGKPKKPLLLNYRPPPGTTLCDTPEARLATIGRTQVVFLDANGDGTFGQPGIDAWTVAGQAYAVPVDAMIIVGTDEVHLQFAAEAVHYRAVPIKAKKEYLDALVKLNDLRLRNGLAPATIDARMSDGCEKHCAYMAKNGIGHAEDKSKPGYTPEGDAAGRASCVNPGACVESVSVFYDTFYHRLPLMHPGTVTFGIGSTGAFTAIDGMRSRRERSWISPVVIPAPESEGHPTLFNASGENPQPFPDGASPGCPLTISFPWGSKPAVTSAEVREGGPKGKPLELLTSWPGNPANPERPENSDSICLMSRRILRPQCRYHARVVYTLGGASHELEWSFTTGS